MVETAGSWLQKSGTMKLNKVLAVFTVLMLGYSVFTVVSTLNVEKKWSTLDNKTSHQSNSTTSSQGRSLLTESKGLMLTGISSRIPIAEDYRILKTIPWTLKEAFWKALGGPHDTALGEISAEYRNHILTAHASCLRGQQKPLAIQFFGHGYSFPIELQNYSSINLPESEISAFVGCVVLVDTQIVENQQVPKSTGFDRQR